VKKSKLLGILVFASFALLGVLFLAPHKASAATFTVDSTADDSDSLVGDGNCDNGSGDCTLRAAIEEANNNQDADTINFNITGSGLHTITPATNYPQIFTTLIIDGSSQPGSNCGTLVDDVLPAQQTTQHTLNIAIDGSNVGTIFDDGFDNTTIKGLNLYNAQSALITIGQNSNVTIECNYLGTNDIGKADASPQNPTGVLSSASVTIQNNLISGLGVPINTAGGGATVLNNLIGTNDIGLTAIPNESPSTISSVATITHNIIAGNNGNGINLETVFATIAGNYIGLNITGSPLANTGDGIFIGTGSTGYTIGGISETDRNVISSNTGSGIHIYNQGGASCPSNTFSTIVGNYIGTNTQGEIQDNYGNTNSGISLNEQEGSGCVNSVFKHRIGGDENGEPNIIAGNDEDGVRIYQSPNMDVFSVSVFRNKIFGNGNLGINLAADSDNDGVADDEIGPNTLNNFSLTYPAEHANNYLNHPVLNSVTTSGDQVTVNYDFAAPSVIENLDNEALFTTDLVGFRLDFYINDNTHDGAYGGYTQQQTWLGSFFVNGSETGANHTFTSPSPLTSNQSISVTATVVWKSITSDCPPDGERFGTGPPYQHTSCGV
jgi:CSLREA domain-containing protein